MGFLAIVASLAVSLAHGQPAAPIPSSTAPLVYAMTVDEYVGFALQHSLPMKIARNSLDNSRYARLSTLRGLYLPTLSGTANASKSYTDTGLVNPNWVNAANNQLTLSQPFLTGTNVALNSTLTDTQTGSSDPTQQARTRQLPQWSSTLTQPLYLFVANPFLRTRNIAELNWATAQNQYDSTKLSAIFNAQNLYYTALVNQETVAVERKKSESSQRVHKITAELVKAGRLARVELSRADIRLKLDLRRIQNAEIQMKQALNSLKDLILLPTEAEVQLLSSLEYQPFNLSLERLLQEAFARNPSVLIAKRQINLDEFQLQIDRETTRPLFNVSGTYGHTGDPYGVGLANQNYNWNANLGLTWFLFDQTKTRLKVKQDQNTVNNDRLNYEQTWRQVQLNIRNAYLDVKRLEDQLSDFEPQRRTARQNLEAVRLQYQNGISRLIDIFDAENDLRNLELEYLNVLLSFNNARNNLSLLVGIDVRQLKP